MKMHRIDYRYKEINNAYHNVWNGNFHFVKADSIDNAIAQFKQEWRHELSELEIAGETNVIDAAHIVKCVNAHDELVAVLDNALGIIHANSTQDCPLTNYPSYREGRAILAKLED